MEPDASRSAASFRRTVAVVAGLNAVYFSVEFVVALSIGSVSLLADSADFIEDASVNVLIFIALGWSAKRRAKLGMVLAAILVAPAGAFLWSLWGKFANPVPPEPFALSLTGGGALLVNFTCALLLARFRNGADSLSRAAFLSARNDVLANVAIVGAGLITAYLWSSVWPDVIVGIAIAAINLGAAKEVLEAAREEHRAQP